MRTVNRPQLQTLHSKCCSNGIRFIVYTKIKRLRCRCTISCALLFVGGVPDVCHIYFPKVLVETAETHTWYRKTLLCIHRTVYMSSSSPCNAVQCPELLDMDGARCHTRSRQTKPINFVAYYHLCCEIKYLHLCRCSICHAIIVKVRKVDYSTLYRWKKTFFEHKTLLQQLIATEPCQASRDKTSIQFYRHKNKSCLAVVRLKNLLT